MNEPCFGQFKANNIGLSTTDVTSRHNTDKGTLELTHRKMRRGLVGLTSTDFSWCVTEQTNAKHTSLHTKALYL